MKQIMTAAAALAVILAAAAPASAQSDRHDHGDRGGQDQRHDDHGQAHNWRQGGRIERGDWERGERVDYRRHHLRHPPRGYEWRQVDGNYILAATATGVIASILAGQH